MARSVLKGDFVRIRHIGRALPILPVKRLRITSRMPGSRLTVCLSSSPTAPTTGGPYQFPEKLIPLIILNAIEGKPLPVYGQGTNVRDWLYVEDHAEGLITLLSNGRPGEKYNFGGDSERTNLEVVERICSTLDEVKSGLCNRGGRSSNLSPIGQGTICATQSMRPKLIANWAGGLRQTFDDGIEKTVHWYLENNAWWGPSRQTVYKGERLGLAEASL